MQSRRKHRFSGSPDDCRRQRTNKAALLQLRACLLLIALPGLVLRSHHQENGRPERALFRQRALLGADWCCAPHARQGAVACRQSRPRASRAVRVTSPVTPALTRRSHVATAGRAAGADRGPEVTRDRPFCRRFFGGVP